MSLARRAFVLSALLVVGCKSGSGGGDSSAPAPASAASGSAGATASGEAPSLRWYGNLTPQTQRTGELAPRSNIKAFGNVELLPAAEGTNRTRVRIVLTAPVENRNFSWAILTGRCGTASTPMLSVDMFPPIEVTANGRGQQDVTIPLQFPGEGTYHLAIYWTAGRDVSDIMTCANLRR